MRTHIQLLIITFFALTVHISIAGEIVQDSLKAKTNQTNPKESAWYEHIKLRGYVQVRYNRLLETNSQLQNEQGDKSWGGDGGFSLRRIRLIFSGDIHKRVFFYIQPDFASSTDGSNLNIGQIRDAYFDLALDTNKTFRLRIGQSKIPYGFENLQSSQNRIPLDRNDALNSAFANERDLGMFFYWAPARIRKLFDALVKDGLKGSGDYGVFAFGVFNGQIANKNEANDRPHVVTRLTYPIKLGKQIIEPGIQAYTGNYVVTTASTGVSGKDKLEYADERAAATFVLYPKPFGVQAEYNFGTGPEYNPETKVIEQKKLQGGYVTASYFLRIKNQILIPFTRYHYYDGGKKHEKDARSYNVKELEIGGEWQPFKNFELVANYTISKRKFEDSAKPLNWQKGNLLRLQAQLNF